MIVGLQARLWVHQDPIDPTQAVLLLCWTACDLHCRLVLMNTFLKAFAHLELLHEKFRTAGRNLRVDLPVSLFDFCSGPLPDSETQFPSLRVLNISNNQLNGGIPASFEQLTLFSKVGRSTCHPYQAAQGRYFVDRRSCA